MGVENKKMEIKRNEEKKWEEIRAKKEIEEDWIQLRIISSSFAENLISKEELRKNIQKRIGELCLVAVITDSIYQGEVIIINKDCQYIFYYKKQVVITNKNSWDILRIIGRKELVREVKKIDKSGLVKIITNVIRNRKQRYTIEQKTTIEAKQMSLFFCLKF